jgi:hypothetical protein
VYQTTFTVRTLHTLHPNLDELTGKLSEGWATFAENDWIGLRTRVANGSSATAPVGLPRNVKWILVGPPCCSPATMQENVYCLGSRANGGAAPRWEIGCLQC